LAKKKPERDEKREKHIDNEINVDCYDEYEQATGWHCYLEDKLQFPFTAKRIASSGKSPLKRGETVQVVGMFPSEDDMDENGDFEVFVFIEWAKRKFAVPLVSTDQETKQP